MKALPVAFSPAVHGQLPMSSLRVLAAGGWQEPHGCPLTRRDLCARGSRVAVLTGCEADELGAPIKSCAELLCLPRTDRK